MNRNEVISLLQAVTASDNRTAGELDIMIWQEVLGTMQLNDCLAALVEFRRESPGVWLEPGHIVRLVRQAVLAQGAADQLTRDEQHMVARHIREQEQLDALTPDERERAWTDEYGDVRVKASDAHREKCMAEIRAILSKPSRRFGLSPQGGVPMAEGDYDDKTRGDTVYAERRRRRVKVEGEGVPKGTTEEVTDWRWCWDKPGGMDQATCGPWVVNKLDAMRQGIEYARTGRLTEAVGSW